ncbi:ATP-dependent zinc metalloprotease FtsH [Zavarzinella formosa]|uniref:ATP-dependent zinc metalloprotease FtsH n=1 Tax=Zavarzinella formosa TaxID=360055 RepID=UPI0002FF47BE|nr:ATP-dependent zinc metalloprotease FtsH [Zavarzinella formosa]
MPPTGTPPRPPEQPNGNPRRAGNMLAAVFILSAVLFVSFFVFVLFTSGPRTIAYNQFLDLAEQGKIAKLTLTGGNKVTGEVRVPTDPALQDLNLTAGRFTTILPHIDNQDAFVRKIIERDLAEHREAIQKKEAKPVEVVTEEDQSQWVGPLVYGVLPIVVLVIFFVFLFPKMRDPMGGGFASSFVKSTARRVDKGMSRTTFNEVAGMDNAKRELVEVVEFLKNPDKFMRLGAQVPKGVLLVGPPGTGKTLLARAVAGEAGVPFYSINGSEFIQMFVGVGASRVRDLFRTAKETAPCVIFIDEIDAVGRMRGAGVGGGSDEREQTLNQILSEMDGFLPSESVIVVAATNRPDVLDAALLRPGRFDRHITVDRPTWQGRFDILKVHVRNKPLADDVDLQKIAKKAMGMSGAELRNLANEAAISAAREGKERIDNRDFDQAAERILLGAKREGTHTPEERRRTAYHEAGHALTAWLEPKADPLWKISILARGQAAGVTMYEPNEDRIDMSKSELFARLVTAMGGRAADRLVFGEMMAGAVGDIKQATRIARMMVTQYGMSDRLGPVAYRAGEEHVFLGKELHETRDFSDGTAKLIDEEVHRLVREAEVRAHELIAANRDKLELLTATLLEREEMDRDEVEKLLGSRPTVSPSAASPQ